MAGCRGTARRAHRRLDRAQRPASREPRRRRLARHRRGCSRDRARHRAARRRRHRARRHHRRGADPAPQGRQGLSAADGEARTAEVLHDAQSDGAARTRVRRTAARVDDQMVEQLRQSAIEGPWETAERLLVCVGPDAQSMDVVRSGEPPRHRPQCGLGRGDGGGAGKRRGRRPSAPNASTTR